MNKKLYGLIVVFIFVCATAGILVWVLMIKPQNNIVSRKCTTEDTNSVQAKRISPQEVEPIEYGGVCYKPIYRDTYPDELFSDMEPIGMSGGILAYYSCKTKGNEYCGTHISETEHYKIIYDQELETDVQEVYFTELTIKNGKLLMRNEAGESFSQELITRDE